MVSVAITLEYHISEYDRRRRIVTGQLRLESLATPLLSSSNNNNMVIRNDVSTIVNQTRGIIRLREKYRGLRHRRLR